MLILIYVVIIISLLSLNKHCTSYFNHRKQVTSRKREMRRLNQEFKKNYNIRIQGGK